MWSFWRQITSSTTTFVPAARAFASVSTTAFAHAAISTTPAHTVFQVQILQRNKTNHMPFSLTTTLQQKLFDVKYWFIWNTVAWRLQNALDWHTLQIRQYYPWIQPDSNSKITINLTSNVGVLTSKAAIWSPDRISTASYSSDLFQPFSINSKTVRIYFLINSYRT